MAWLGCRGPQELETFTKGPKKDPNNLNLKEGTKDILKRVGISTVYVQNFHPPVRYITFSGSYFLLISRSRST